MIFTHFYQTCMLDDYKQCYKNTFSLSLFAWNGHIIQELPVLFIVVTALKLKNKSLSVTVPILTITNVYLQGIIIALGITVQLIVAGVNMWISSRLPCLELRCQFAGSMPFKMISNVLRILKLASAVMKCPFTNVCLRQFLKNVSKV